MHQNLRLFNLFIFISLPIILFSQNGKRDSFLALTVIDQAEKMMMAAKDENWDEWIKYINPVWYDYPGGKKDFINNFKMRNQWGIHSNKPQLIDISFMRPSVFVYNEKSIQCAFKFTANLKFDHRIKKHKSIMIGVSRDNGESWFFIDTLNKKLKDLRHTFPFLNENLRYN